MNTRPSPYLPPWALRYYELHRDRVDGPDEMAHRRNAFYRLLCADAGNGGMRLMWERVARFISEPTVCHFVPGPHAAEDHVTDTDMEARDFLDGLIRATDHALEGGPVPDLSKLSSHIEPRLREPDRLLARKLARLLREWKLVTPFNCIAGLSLDRSNMQGIDAMIDRLMAVYRFELAAPDMNEIFERHGIKHTTDSKRGWRARRRASDAVRQKVIAAALRLAEIGHPNDAGDLAGLAYSLRLFPDMKTEHADEPDLRIQKSGWPDWLRVARVSLQGIGERDGFMRHCDWAALVLALFDVVATEERIGQVLREGQ